MGVVYGSLAATIIGLLSLEIASILLLLGAQVIAEYERLEDGDTAPPGGAEDGGCPHTTEVTERVFRPVTEASDKARVLRVPRPVSYIVQAS